MISAKLVHLLEQHSDEIARAFLRDVAEDTRLKHLASLPKSDLQDRCMEIIQHLGNWLTTADSKKVASHFEQIGRKRYQERVPLREIVLWLQMLKRRMLRYIREQGVSRDTVEIYAEEELEHQLGAFIDSAIYHAVGGYEEARDELLSYARAS